MSESSIKNNISNTVQRISAEITGNKLLEELKNEFDTIPQRLDEPMQLAIVGKISSSKSTLVNAVLGQEEVVRTGEMEETWNVSWLKYGDPKSDIIVHYKDGKKDNVSREMWNQWANRDRIENDKLKNAVSYIEVAYNNAILKKINIIDTPGLDSFYGTDSQNTLDFLKKVRPDAVIMLFSKSINADTLTVIEDFRQGVGAGLSPINAMGVMAKIDNIWASDPELIPLKEAKKISARLMTVESVKNTLFNIYPVTALVALSASTISENDLKLLESLSQIYEDTWEDMLISEGRFVKEYEDVRVSVEDRLYLRNKFGRYAISIMTEKIRNNNDADIQQIKKILLEQSGFKEFMDILFSHFSEKSVLIKSYSSIFALSVMCRKTRRLLADHKDTDTTMAFLKLEKVITNLDELVKSLTIEFNIVGIMKEIYEGKFDIESSELEELRRVSGEFGSSCPDRFGLLHNDTIDTLIRTATERIIYWTKCYNIEGMAFPTKGRFYKIMITIYVQLLKEIKAAAYKYESSSKFLFRSV